MNSLRFGNNIIVTNEQPEPEHLQDCLTTKAKIYLKLVFKKKEKKLRQYFVSASMDVNFKQARLDLLKEFKYVFAWTYAEMPRLDLQLVTHQLNFKGGTKPVRQVSRNFRQKLEVQIK